MPARSGKNEQVLIDLFVSAYENCSWAGSHIDRLDERLDGKPEALVTRHTDGQTMAIEHTLIEPFMGDKRDLAMFEPPFLKIEQDESLAVPDSAISVFIPVGILHRQKPAQRDVIVQTIHSWIASNRLLLREGEHKYECTVSGIPSVTLTVKRSSFRPQQSRPGSLQVRRQQVTNDLDKVIERALRRKLPKLVNTPADRHVLLLERDQFTFHPDLIFSELERQRANFPLLQQVDEIWHVETVFYKHGGHVYFELKKNDRLLATMTFDNEALIEHSKDGIPYPS